MHRGRVGRKGCVVVSFRATAPSALLPRSRYPARMTAPGSAAEPPVLPYPADAVERLETIPGIATVRFDRGDVVRHPLVARIVEAYEGGDPSPPAIGNNQN